MNIAIIVMDSCRFDTTQKAHIPNIEKYGNFELAYSHGSFTLPAHIALFQIGALPYNFSKTYHYRDSRFFKIWLPWDRNTDAVYRLPEKSLNIVKGFELLDYRTVCIGGVNFWNTEFETSKIWNNYFQEVYWNKNFDEHNERSFKNQIEFIENLNLINESRLFFFINIATTHLPYIGGMSKKGQIRSLEYIDKLFNDLIDLLPRPLHVFLFADHGDCIGEDELFGHGFFHQKVFEVPIMNFIIPS